MRTILRIALPAFLFLPAARAQNASFAGWTPVLEAGGGYSYVNMGIPSQSRIGMNGFVVTGNADLSGWFGVAVDLGYARTGNALGSSHPADLFTYMAGPVFYPVRKRHMNVYIHELFGGARETGINYANNGDLLYAYVNKFAWAVGGGVQYRLSRSLSVRAGADYLHTAFITRTWRCRGNPVSSRR
jgi:Outer membrane protein beta-barrel domain